MRKRYQVYKCEVCGNIVQILHGSVGTLVCCNKPMRLFEEKTDEDGKEKHVPVIDKLENGIKVKIGSIPHPMEENHYVEWIEVIAGDKICRKHLSPGDAPEAIFNIIAEDIIAREYCSVHGHWRSQ